LNSKAQLFTQPNQDSGAPPTATLASRPDNGRCRAHISPMALISLSSAPSLAGVRRRRSEPRRARWHLCVCVCECVREWCVCGTQATSHRASSMCRAVGLSWTGCLVGWSEPPAPHAFVPTAATVCDDGVMACVHSACCAQCVLLRGGEGRAGEGFPLLSQNRQCHSLTSLSPLRFHHLHSNPQ
jgi:hypothetical protein